MTLQIESPALHCGAETELNKMSLRGSIDDRNIIIAVRPAQCRKTQSAQVGPMRRAAKDTRRAPHRRGRAMSGRGMAQKSLDLIEHSRNILAELHPTTVRGVAYQLFTRGLIENGRHEPERFAPACPQRDSIAHRSRRMGSLSNGRGGRAGEPQLNAGPRP